MPTGGSLDFDPGPWEAWDMERRTPVLRMVFRILYEAAPRRSEETMNSNYFDSTILGTSNHGQVILVDGTHRSALRVSIAKFARRLALCLASWRAFKRTPAGMTPAMAMCPSYSELRRQRSVRWTPGVVVGPGTVGVC
jgi:hypothetical protein